MGSFSAHKVQPLHCNQQYFTPASPIETDKMQKMDVCKVRVTDKSRRLYDWLRENTASVGIGTGMVRILCSVFR